MSDVLFLIAAVTGLVLLVLAAIVVYLRIIVSWWDG
jgi:hypothetical protein